MKLSGLVSGLVAVHTSGHTTEVLIGEQIDFTKRIAEDERIAEACGTWPLAGICRVDYVRSSASVEEEGTAVHAVACPVQWRRVWAASGNTDNGMVQAGEIEDVSAHRIRHSGADALDNTEQQQHRPAGVCSSDGCAARAAREARRHVYAAPSSVPFDASATY
jgi:hypothetical protein